MLQIRQISGGLTQFTASMTQVQPSFSDFGRHPDQTFALDVIIYSIDRGLNRCHRMLEPFH